MIISIALATYNGEKYLKEQLDSYLSQVRLPDELVVCDDSSNDDTVSILRNFKKVAPFPVKIIINAFNLGYTKNFEKVLSLCSGDLVFFSDQDDVWLPNKIKVVEKTFINNESISLVIHDGELVNENLDSTEVTKLSQIRAGGYDDSSFVTGTLSALHRNLLPLVLPFPCDISGGHDGWVHTISKLVDRKKIIEDTLQKIRRHDDNTSQWIVNSLNTVNKFDVLRSEVSTKAACSYEDRIYYNSSLMALFNKLKKGQVIISFTFDLEKLMKSLEAEYPSLIKRQNLLSKGFLGRKLQALSMFLNGDYNYFNGYKSFIRDLLR